MSTTNKLGDPCPLVVYPSSPGQGNPCLLVTVYNKFLHNFFEQVEPPCAGNENALISLCFT
jgi:hypothetical protein